MPAKVDKLSKTANAHLLYMPRFIKNDTYDILKEKDHPEKISVIH